MRSTTWPQRQSLRRPLSLATMRTRSTIHRLITIRTTNTSIMTLRSTSTITPPVVTTWACHPLIVLRTHRISTDTRTAATLLYPLRLHRRLRRPITLRLLRQDFRLPPARQRRDPTPGLRHCILRNEAMMPAAVQLAPPTPSSTLLLALLAKRKSPAWNVVFPK